MITRQDYMNTISDDRFDEFRIYYAQFVNKDIKELVERTFTKDKLINARKEDIHFNNIPMWKWDKLAGMYPVAEGRANKALIVGYDRWNDTGGNSELKRLVNKSLLKEAGEGWSLSTATCILKEAARQIAEE